MPTSQNGNCVAFAWTTSGMETMNAIAVAITDSKKKHDKDKTVEHIEPEKLPGK